MKLIRTAQVLFITDVLVWLAFGIFGFLWVSQRYPHQSLVALLLGLLALGNASVLALSAFLLGKSQKKFYYFAFIVLVSNIIVGLMDELGFYDYAFLTFELIMLIILIASGKYYS
jgi:hypothetical protein